MERDGLVHRKMPRDAQCAEVDERLKASKYIYRGEENVEVLRMKSKAVKADVLC